MAQTYELRNDSLRAVFTDAGAALMELQVPDRLGRPGDVVLGFADPRSYLSDHPCLGTIVGRVAGRIAGARFELDGQKFELPANLGAHHIHGDFHRRLWRAQIGPIEGSDEPTLRFSLASPDGDGGFPGRLALDVTYSLGPTNELRIEYEATSDRATPLNLTNHSYFNLAGAERRGDVLDHELTLHADGYTAADAENIPTGEIKSVAGTPLDFRAPRTLGEGIDDEFLAPYNGYDHNFVLDAWQENTREPFTAALVREPTSGRVMRVFTTEPGIQLYTAGHFDGTLEGRYGPLTRAAGFCLECQHFPDSIHQPRFPTTILRPGETYRQTTIYKFETDAES